MAYLYKDIYVKYHPKRRGNGCVSEHILVAEEKLGRYLFDGEYVHHVDEDKSNNSPENLMVFCTNADHTRFHSGYYERLEEQDNGSWMCLTKIQYCEHCGKGFDHSSKRNRFCSIGCANSVSRTCDRPTKEELNKLLIDNNFSKVGKIYNVSDNAIRKWCKQYNMSTKAKDYIKQ